jgi:protein-S-isoprenylcysteine O-methyltransferase Ste14
MIAVIKNLFSFILPITVLIIIPIYIEQDFTIIPVNALIGLPLIIAGLSAMFLTISSFIRIGKGTLAPWSPTKKLVIRGMYRYVRNPMIMGVMTVLIGEAIVFMSRNLLEWAGIFFLINTIYFIIYEEPDLEQKFGEEYREYKRNVGRWIPRLKPFKPGSQISH